VRRNDAGIEIFGMAKKESRKWKTKAKIYPTVRYCA
jgi:hypothetical protein